MEFIQTILMGIVQGLSEFLPISSSAHIIFTSNLYKMATDVASNHSSQEILFDIMLHLGTLISILIYFRKELWTILKSFCKAIKTKDFSDKDAKIALYVLIGTVLTVAIAYPLKDFTESLVNNPFCVAMLLIVTSAMLFLSEYVSKHYEAKQTEINLKTAIIMGLAQGLAVFPGFSRSGWTIASGLFSGLDRVSATRYSFLLVIPIILGTSILYPLLEIHPSELVTFAWAEMIVGTLVSAIVGYVCIKYFLKFVAKFSLKIFAYYCLIVGIVMAVIFR